MGTTSLPTSSAAPSLVPRQPSPHPTTPDEAVESPSALLDTLAPESALLAFPRSHSSCMGQSSAVPCTNCQQQKVTRKSSRGLALTEVEHAPHIISVPAQIGPPRQIRRSDPVNFRPPDLSGFGVR